MHVRAAGGLKNDALKSVDIIDVPIWRLIQHLVDLRIYVIFKRKKTR